jgi:hypothetical protein
MNISTRTPLTFCLAQAAMPHLGAEMDKPDADVVNKELVRLDAVPLKRMILLQCWW